MMIWFLTLFSFGIYRITATATIFQALNPIEGFKYIGRNGAQGYLSLGSVFLAVTGLEALYADLGHFGVGAIRVSWLCLVYPSLVINYLGQGALLLTDISAIDNPFYRMVPKPLFWPVLILATFATVIASQALITGCFSLVSQAISLGVFPAFAIKHKSKRVFGQIYISEVNYFLMILTILVVIGFKHSSNITQAYGFTVCCVMTLTTILYILVMRNTWNLPYWRVIPFGIFLLIDFAFLGANAAKIPNGGWVAIMFGAFFALIMLIWYFGERRFKKVNVRNMKMIDVVHLRAIIKPEQTVESLNFPRFTFREGVSDIERGIENLELPADIYKGSGMAVFLNSNYSDVPEVFQLFVNYFHVVPHTIVFLTLNIVTVPVIPKEEKIALDRLGKDIWTVHASVGYGEGRVKIEDIIKIAIEQGLPNEPFNIFYNREQIRVRNKNLFLRIVYTLYAFMKKFFIGTFANFELPSTNVVALGVQAIL